MEKIILLIAACAFIIYGFLGQRVKSSTSLNELGWIRIAAGFSMSFIGGAATIAMAGIGYSNGLIGFVDPAVVLIGGILVAFSIKNKNAPKTGQGIASYLASGSTVRTFIYAICSFFVYALLAGAQVVALIKIFAPYLGSFNATLLSVGLFAAISAYIFLGGIAAVTRTDLAQFLVVAGLFFLPAIFGIIQLSVIGISDHAVSQTPLELRTILLLSLSLLFVPLSQDVWVRIRSAKSKSSARIGVSLGAFLYFLIVGAAIVLGDQSAKSGIIVEDAEQILPFFFASQLGLAGVVTTMVILAAVMSTLDSFTYNLNSTLSDDVVPYITKSKQTNILQLCVGIIVFLVVTIIATAANSILGLVLTALMIYVAVIGPGFVMSNWTKSEVTLWLPALITLIGIMTLSLLDIQIPYEPYSFIGLHTLMIVFGMVFEKIMNANSG